MKIAVLGGTGKQGFGLALRWAKAGHEIVIGSRTAEKAEQAAQRMSAWLHGAGTVCGLANQEAAAAGEVVVLSVPYESQQSTLEAVKSELADKLVISVVVPLKPPKVAVVWQPEAGSAAAELQVLLGEDAHLVTAFQNISAEHLTDPDHTIDSDVLICGDRKADKQIVLQLAADASLHGVDAGPLANAGVVEGLTAVLIGINKRYQAKGAGIRITGMSGGE